MFRKIFLSLVLAGISASGLDVAMAQDKSDYIGGGITLGSTSNNTPFSTSSSSTVAGGFAQGIYSFGVFEFKGGMTVTNKRRFGFDANTFQIDPKMYLPVQLSKNVEFLVGGGVDSQMGGQAPTSVNPLASFGLRFNRKYTFTYDEIFSDMVDNSTGNTFRGFSVKGELVHPVSSSVAFLAGAEYNCQRNGQFFGIVPASREVKFKVGLALK